jgi:hypothetical protein
MSQSPAGWYPQTDGRQRYWDGQQWTEQFTPGKEGMALTDQPAAVTTGKPTRAWYTKKRVIIPGALIALFAIIGALSGGGDDTTPDIAPVAAETSGPAKPAVAATPAAETSPTASKPAASKSAASKPAAPKPPELTSGQKNALRSAENYIEMMGMSKAGLIRQLSSPAGEGYSKADATFAANHVKADWNAEAIESAKNYMEMMPMSRAALIQQLSSPAGEQFTKAQATQAADAVLR